jgi:hypothetical protein
MAIELTLDNEPLTENELQQLYEKAKRLQLSMITPDSWNETTGRSEEQLVNFIHNHCRIHDIRKFLSGEEQLGYAPRIVLFDMPEGKIAYLVSLQPEYVNNQRSNS